MRKDNHKPHTSSDQHAPVVVSGKDEMNLAEFPIARLGHHDTRTVIEYRGQIVDKSGSVVEQTWIVSGAAPFGLPTEFADRVLVALITISAKDQFTNRKVSFTIYRVLAILGIAPNKQYYKAVERALQQLVGVTIYSEGAFWDKVTQKRITTKKGFHVLEEFWLKSSETDDSVIETESVNGYIVWGERIWESFKVGYIKHLDTDFYCSLEKTIARRLYRFLDKRMHYQNTYQIDVFDLAARLGMKPYRYPSDLIEKMKDSFNELHQRGYLESAEVIKVGKFTRIKFTRAGTANPIQKELPLAPAAIATPEAPKVDAFTKEDPLSSLYADYGTPDTLKQVWVNILQEWKNTMVKEIYFKIDNSVLLDVHDSTAVIALHPHIIDWANRQLNRKIRTCLTTSLKMKITNLEFIALP
jgi:hypothetical protein